MPSITSANLAHAIVKLVAVEALPALVGNLVMGNLVNRDFEPSLAQAGDVVNVPISPVMTANDMFDGESVRNQNPVIGSTSILLDKHKEATFQIPDVTKVVAVPDLLKLYMQPAVIALAEAIERDLMGLAPRFSTPNTPLGTAGSNTITEAIIDQAETALFNQKVSGAQQKYLVVDSTAYSVMRSNTRFSEYSTSGDAGLRAIVDGSIGKLKDFFVLRSQYVNKTGTAPATVTTNNLAFAKNAIGLVTRRLPQPLPGTGAVAEYAEFGNFGMRVVMSYAPNTLAQQFTVDVLYGCAALRTAHGVLIQS